MSEDTPSKWSQRLPALLAAVGLLCSALLELVHYRAYTAPSAMSFCSIGSSFDCGTVALSRWSVVLGLPVPIWGVIGFQAMGLAARERSSVLLPLSAFAAGASAVLLGLELFAIHSVCLLCEVVHLTSFALFVSAWRLRKELVPFTRAHVTDVLGIPLFFLALAYVVVPGYWRVFQWKDGVALPHGVDAAGHYWIGAEKPKVVLDEYTDYRCPHCAVVTTRLREYLAKHPTALRIVHHNYARMDCQRDLDTCRFARVANCAGEQGKFWEMDSWLFENAPHTPKVDVSIAAGDLGLDAARLQACVESDAAFARAQAETDAAVRGHVVDTPTFFLDGKRYVGGEIFKVLDSRL